MAEAGDVDLVFCRSHVRQRFYELATAGRRRSPVRRSNASGGSTQDIRGHTSEQQRIVHQHKSRSIADEFEPWLRGRPVPIGQKAPLADAIRHALSRWERLTRFIDDGIIEVDSNVVERSIRPIAFNR